MPEKFTHLNDHIQYHPVIMQAGPYSLPLHQKTHVMGILNVTPDSFSDGGKYVRVDQAIDQAAKLVAEGADILDIGGESTRPGSTQISADEELERVIPVLNEIAKRFPIPLSIDTYKANVAQQALQAGAHIINDVWGAQADPDMADIAVQYDAPLIITHNRRQADYEHLIKDMLQDLLQSLDFVIQKGLKSEKIIVDPGIGFAKDAEQSLSVMRHLEKFAALGFPLLIGTSRKRFIDYVLHLPPDDRSEGTLATLCLGVSKGCHIVRVHEVCKAVRAVKMMDAMLGKGEQYE